MAYNYIRLASVQPTVRGFLLILVGNITQSLAAQEKRDQKKGIPSNPHALGINLDVVHKIEGSMTKELDSSDPEDLVKLKAAITKKFNDTSPVRLTIKAIDAYLQTGKAPAYPKGQAAPLWKA